VVKKRRGRPVGSKNKLTSTAPKRVVKKTPVAKSVPVKKRRGRPVGSKNKKTAEVVKNASTNIAPVKKRRGRPLGSKNKKTLTAQEKSGVISTAKAPAKVTPSKKKSVSTTTDKAPKKTVAKTGVTRGRSAVKAKSTTTKSAKKKTSDLNIANTAKGGSYTQWLLALKPKGEIVNSQKKSLGQKAKDSVRQKEEIASESLAKLYAKQGHKQKAIEMYEKLGLIIPEKSSFFAAQISKLKSK